MNASVTRPSSSSLEDERVRLVQPRHAVVVEHLRVLELRLVGEARRLGAPICLEMGCFRAPPESHGSRRVGRPAATGFTRRSRLRSWRRDGRPFTIAHLSDLHCGEPFFLPDLIERAIAEINDARPGHRRLLGRPDVVRLQGGVRAGEALPRRGSSASRSSSSRATTTRATSATSTSRSSSASATRCCARTA